MILTWVSHAAVQPTINQSRHGCKPKPGNIRSNSKSLPTLATIVVENYAAAAAYLNKTLIPSGEALGIGWSRNMLYSGFTTLPRSVVRRQIGFTVRIIRTLCRRPSDMRLRSVDRRLLKPLGQPSEQGDAPLQSPDPLTIITWATWTHHLSVSGRRSTPRSSKLARH